MNLKIVFDQPIQESDFKKVMVSGTVEYLEFQGAVIPFSRKNYSFPKNNFILVGQNTPKKARVVVTLNQKFSYKLRFEGKNLYITFLESDSQGYSKKSSNNSENTPDVELKSMDQIRKDPQVYRVVLDPGHGGKDCGTLGVNKVCEKDIVLGVARLAEKHLKSRGYKVFMTRDSDVYIDLKKRTEIANAQNAHIFISIHANSIDKDGDKKRQGVETYFLSTARSERAKEVAEQENKGDVAIMDYFSKLSFLNTLSSHRLISSNKLAIDIQFHILKESRRIYPKVVDGGVREGPFWVLAGALMPSVLIEIGYNSNPIESSRLMEKKYQDAIATGIANGVDAFVAKNF